MSDIAAIAERALLARQRLPDAFGSDAVRPSYDGLGLVNASALAAAWLAPDAPRLSDLEPAPPLAPELLDQSAVTRAWHDWLARGRINHVIVLVMDALGYDQLGDMMRDGTASHLAGVTRDRRAFFMPITTVYPSTTTAALASVATAYPPADHGVTATIVYLREIGSLVNMIGHRPLVGPTAAPYLDTQLNPDTLLPVPNLYRRLEHTGVQTAIVNVAQFKGTSISRWSTAGSQAGEQHYYGYLTPADGFSQCRTRVFAHIDQGRSFTYVYVPSVDSTAHRYGPLSAGYRAEMASLDFALHHELIEPLAGRADTVLLLTADHGQCHSHTEKIAWLNDHPKLARMLQTPLAGEGRAGFLYLKHGMEAAAIDYIDQSLAEHFLALPRQRAAELGLFGPPGRPLGPQCADRVGDVLLIPRTDWIARHHLVGDDRVPPFAGVHGGLSRAEMLVPFLAYRFG